MKRGEIWTVSGGKDYAGKPRPGVIVQDDRSDATDTITLCVITKDPTDAPLLRLVVVPNAQTSLQASSSPMVDKINTVSKSKWTNSLVRLTMPICRGFTKPYWSFLGRLLH